MSCTQPNASLKSTNAILCQVYPPLPSPVHPLRLCWFRLDCRHPYLSTNYWTTEAMSGIHLINRRRKGKPVWIISVYNYAYIYFIPKGYHAKLPFSITTFIIIYCFSVHLHTAKLHIMPAQLI